MNTAEARDLFSRPDLGLRYFQGLEQAALTVPGIFAAAWPVPAVPRV